jgi:spore coat protein CotH
VDLDRPDYREFHGLHAMLLQAGALDPTKAREALAFAVFRAAGVPAPRTAMAELTLTVPGRFDRAYLGLYTLVEPVDRAFLVDRFHTDRGLLLRPQGMRGLDSLGDDWEKYRGPHRPLAEPRPEQARRLVEFTRLVHQADDDRFRREIGSYLDVDKFLRFMAVHALIANADGFFTLAYNYTLFLEPSTNRFIFIPGDQELAFANFLMMGTADQLMSMSVSRPYGNENRLAGGGVRPDLAYGRTDDFGYDAVENPMHAHDVHATILHLLGLDHEHLTFRYAGRDMRLTDVKGKVHKGILA